MSRSRRTADMRTYRRHGPGSVAVRKPTVVYLKTFLVGIGGSVVAMLLWITCALLLPIYLPFLISRVTGTGGVGAAYIGSGSVLAAALIGFIIGAAWEMKRLHLI